jgi:hypothetical protein
MNARNAVRPIGMPFFTWAMAEAISSEAARISCVPFSTIRMSVSIHTGWKQVEIIDSDLGCSASMASARREGSERVLSAVPLAG